MIAAAVLTKEEVVLEGCPKISDVEDMAEIVRSLGGTVWWERNALHLNSGGYCHRIFPFHTCNIDFRIHQISTSEARKTGPSLQTRLLCTLLCASFSLLLHTQPRQAPIPQAMRSSREI